MLPFLRKKQGEDGARLVSLLGSIPKRSEAPPGGKLVPETGLSKSLLDSSDLHERADWFLGRYVL
jgi:hypothetical protein